MTIFHLSSRAISTRRGDNGAWQKFERGEIELWDFYVAFGGSYPTPYLATPGTANTAQGKE
jgi:hypothetical protein